MPGQSRKAKKYTLGKAKETMDLLLPSGNVCLVIRPGVQGLIKHGILDSLDTLTGIVQQDLIDANDPKAQLKAAQALASKPDDLLAAMDLMDKVLEYVVKEPRPVRPIRRDATGKPLLTPEGKEIPLAEEEREDEVTYTDEVDLDDKLFIFQFVVGGTRDIESFRAQRQAVLGGVPTGQDVPLSAE